MLPRKCAARDVPGAPAIALPHGERLRDFRVIASLATVKLELAPLHTAVMLTGRLARAAYVDRGVARGDTRCHKCSAEAKRLGVPDCLDFWIFSENDVTDHN